MLRVKAFGDNCVSYELGLPLALQLHPPPHYTLSLSPLYSMSGMHLAQVLLDRQQAQFKQTSLHCESTKDVYGAHHTTHATAFFKLVEHLLCYKTRWTTGP